MCTESEYLAEYRDFPAANQLAIDNCERPNIGRLSAISPRTAFVCKTGQAIGVKFWQSQQAHVQSSDGANGMGGGGDLDSQSSLLAICFPGLPCSILHHKTYSQTAPNSSPKSVHKQV